MLINTELLKDISHNFTRVIDRMGDQTERMLQIRSQEEEGKNRAPRTKTGAKNIQKRKMNSKYQTIKEWFFYRLFALFLVIPFFCGGKIQTIEPNSLINQHYKMAFLCDIVRKPDDTISLCASDSAANLTVDDWICARFKTVGGRENIPLWTTMY